MLTISIKNNKPTKLKNVYITKEKSLKSDIKSPEVTPTWHLHLNSQVIGFLSWASCLRDPTSDKWKRNGWMEKVT